MALPPSGPPGEPGQRRWLFSQAAFRLGWTLAAICVGLGVLLVVLADGALESVGASLLALGVLGALTAGLGLLGERVAARRERPGPAAGEPPPVNGHRPRRPRRPTRG